MLTDAEYRAIDAIREDTVQLPIMDRLQIAYRAGADAASVPLLATIERMRVAAMMQDWDEFNAALHDAALAATQREGEA